MSWLYGAMAVGPWAGNGVEMERDSRMVICIYIYMYNEAILRKQNAFKKSSSAIVLEGCYFSASF